MNRDKNPKSVAYLLLFSFCLIFMDQKELWAKTRFSTDLAPPKYFLLSIYFDKFCTRRIEWTIHINITQS